MRKQKGFTLIELLVVIAIIGVIVVVAGFSSGVFGSGEFSCWGPATNETTLQRTVYGQLAAVELQEPYMTFYLQGGAKFTVRSSSVNDSTMPGLNETNMPFDSRWTYMLRQVDTRYSTIIYDLQLAIPDRSPLAEVPNRGYRGVANTTYEWQEEP